MNANSYSNPEWKGFTVAFYEIRHPIKPHTDLSLMISFFMSSKCFSEWTRNLTISAISFERTQNHVCQDYSIDRSFRSVSKLSPLNVNKNLLQKRQRRNRSVGMVRNLLRRKKLPWPEMGHAIEWLLQKKNGKGKFVLKWEFGGKILVTCLHFIFK